MNPLTNCVPSMLCKSKQKMQKYTLPGLNRRPFESPTKCCCKSNVITTTPRVPLAQNPGRFSTYSVPLSVLHLALHSHRIIFYIASISWIQVNYVDPSFLIPQLHPIHRPHRILLCTGIPMAMLIFSTESDYNILTLLPLASCDYVWKLNLCSLGQNLMQQHEQTLLLPGRKRKGLAEQSRQG